MTGVVGGGDRACLVDAVLEVFAAREMAAVELVVLVAGPGHLQVGADARIDAPDVLVARDQEAAAEVDAGRAVDREAPRLVQDDAVVVVVEDVALAAQQRRGLRGELVAQRRQEDAAVGLARAQEGDVEAVAIVVARVECHAIAEEPEAAFTAYFCDSALVTSRDVMSTICTMRL